MIEALLRFVHPGIEGLECCTGYELKETGCEGMFCLIFMPGGGRPNLTSEVGTVVSYCSLTGSGSCRFGLFFRAPFCLDGCLGPGRS